MFITESFFIMILVWFQNKCSFLRAFGNSCKDAGFSFSLQQLMSQLTHAYASYGELEVAAFKLLQLMYICKLLCNSPLTPELHLWTFFQINLITTQNALACGAI